MTLFRTLTAAAALAGSLTFVAGAHAQTRWQHHHPWRAYDNAQLAHQNRRITQGLREGELSRGQARALRSDDRAIRAEERADASLHGSHLGYRQQRQINAQETANSRAIYDARHY